MPSIPESLLHRYNREKRIKLDGKRAPLSTRIEEGSTVELYIKDEFFEKNEKDAFRHLIPNLNIVFEDENILLVDKVPGLIVHSDEKNETDTLINRVLSYLYKKGEWNPDDENTFTPALCNRIDRNTGGIVICAKNAPSLRCINELIKNREIDKKYLALVHGIPAKKSGKISNWLLKNPDTNMVSVFTSPRKGALEAHSLYKVIKSSPSRNISLVEVSLLTGRTHQIRAQFADMGHPLVGDGKYGINREDKKLGYKFQALYSYKLTFLPSDENSLLSYLKGREFEVDEVFFKNEI
jgi:23S rRNA pseudouridine955/2504/2580 synthase